MGVSGGSISNMILTLYGKTIHQAVATSAGLGVPITLAGTLGYMVAGLPQQHLMPPLSIGFVSLIGFVLMAPISSLTAGYGARLAHAMSKRHLEIAFGLFLLAAALRFLIDQVGVDRVVMGSDWPFVPWHPSPVAWLQGLKALSPEQKEKILWRNLETLLKL